MHINELTDELVKAAYEATDLKPGRFNAHPQVCVLEAVAAKEGGHWTNVLDDASSMNDFVNVWDRLSSGCWEMRDRQVWRIPPAPVDDSLTPPELPSEIKITTEGGQRAVDLWNYLTDQGMITGK